jgi:hypothetical protein
MSEKAFRSKEYYNKKQLAYCNNIIPQSKPLGYSVVFTKHGILNTKHKWAKFPQKSVQNPG